MTEEQRMKNEALTIEAAKVYADVARYGDMDTIRHALHHADHEGWMRGFSDRERIYEKYDFDYTPHYFAMGWVLGALLMFAILRP